MNYGASDWDMDDDSRPLPDLLPKGDSIPFQQKKTMGPANELIELLWRNGQVVLRSQTNRKSLVPFNDPKPVSSKPEQLIKSGFMGFSTEDSGWTNQNPTHEDVTSSWLHYPLDDSLGNEFCSDFFYEMPASDPIGIENPNKQVAEGDKAVKVGFSEAAIRNQGPERRPQPVLEQSSNVHFAENVIPRSQFLMPPPNGQITDTNPQTLSPNLARIVNFSHFSRPGMTNKADLGSSSEPFGENGSRNLIQVEVGESSMTTIGSSKCGSNQIENQANLNYFSSNGGNTRISMGAVAETAQKMHFQSNRGEATEPTVASSSGGSGGSAGRTGKQIYMNQSNKRKGRDAEESECLSEEAEDGSIEANKPAQKSASARRSRASEIHNLSERRRRDRINEKMKALQELIPHCNKSDKASMLDEAIEYLKSLQLQLQIMWMGGGMVPIMFPGVQHYMPPVGVGPAPLPYVNGSSQLPGLPLMDQSRTPATALNQLPLCVPPALNPVNSQKQMKNSSFPESYKHFLSLHHMQNSPQTMNLFTYGSQMVQQNQMTTQPGSSSSPCIGGALSENIQSGKAG